VNLPVGFTGLDQAYEKPDCPDLVVKTVDCSVDESMSQVTELLIEHVPIQSILNLTFII
jgi:adenylylsulfate kinase-like enzyme